jgi:catechol 2,3-dioxygenase-like lactoylglutathione lyase family enzyme
MHSRFLAALFLAVLPVAVAAQLPDQPLRRPRITGISHLAVYAADPAATDKFYREIVGAVKLPDPENPEGVRYALSATQFIEVLPLPADAGINRLDHTAWNTDDAEAMRKYLASKAWKVPPGVQKGADGSLWFTVKDAEGNRVEFVQPPSPLKPVDAPLAIGHHIIHVGFVVHSRAVEDTFYRDLLGFRPYWYGGRQDGVVDWVSQQVPDGHDWLEYMLVRDPLASGIPASITQRSLGVMDHFSIGEDSVPETFKMLTEENRMGGNTTAQPKIGLDGKYQLNLFDPDGTRLEMMNFHATQKPCCSPFTSSDPDR